MSHSEQFAKSLAAIAYNQKRHHVGALTLALYVTNLQQHRDYRAHVSDLEVIDALTRFKPVMPGSRHPVLIVRVHGVDRAERLARGWKDGGLRHVELTLVTTPEHGTELEWRTYRGVNDTPQTQVLYQPIDIESKEPQFLELEEMSQHLVARTLEHLSDTRKLIVLDPTTGFSVKGPVSMHKLARLKFEETPEPKTAAEIDYAQILMQSLDADVRASQH